MAVILAATMMATPAIVRTLETYRLDSGASMVFGKLMEARLSAIKRNRPSWVAIDSAAGIVQVRTTDGNPPSTTDLGAVGLLQQSVSFQAGTPAEVRFDSMGRPVAPQTLVVETSQLQKTVSISAAGRIRIN